MLRVLVAGAQGKMGQECCQAIYKSAEFELHGGYNPHAHKGLCTLKDTPVQMFNNLTEALVGADILLDFSVPGAALQNVNKALSAGVHCVVGTTGTSAKQWQEVYEPFKDKQLSLFVAPNFTIGAVLLMHFSKIAARYLPEAEVIEYHHSNKKDAPSGTACHTAQIIAQGRGHTKAVSPGKETELESALGARGALIDGVFVHAVRSHGYVASQEVIFGDYGQTLSIRHDSIDRASYMPGVLLALQKVAQLKTCVIGLENLMEL